MSFYLHFMDKQHFYITTTLPYVNAEPHLGFAMELVQADVIARFQASLGKEVFFNTGTDEHGLKIYRKAIDQGKDPQTYVDEYAAKFDALKIGLNVSYNHFIRTTDPHHKAAAQEFWNRCLSSGDIYTKIYKVKYCVGCELEKTDSELVDGACPIHPTTPIELIEEENYFFRFSKYQQPLLDLYNKRPDFVVPETRLHEIKSFVGAGLVDFSISRLKEKMPWGIPVPGDENQVMYVWFDALINYISTIGWPQDESAFHQFWPGVQIAGKDNLRQQSAMWQAMLLSAGLPHSEQIIIHGFVNSNGQKMSKSLGNVINPFDIVEKYGTDALRYWIIREANMFEDSDFTWEKFKESYNANLANGLGNLVSRILKLAITHDVRRDIVSDLGHPSYIKALEEYRLKDAIDYVWIEIGKLDRYIQHTEPFKTIKTDPIKARLDIKKCLGELDAIAHLLKPFMPSTSERIKDILNEPILENIPRLFPRAE
jgi:methionyl-tRNA synthetase